MPFYPKIGSDGDAVRGARCLFCGDGRGPSMTSGARWTSESVAPSEQMDVALAWIMYTCSCCKLGKSISCACLWLISIQDDHALDLGLAYHIANSRQLALHTRVCMPKHDVADTSLACFASLEVYLDARMRADAHIYMLSVDLSDAWAYEGCSNRWVRLNSPCRQDVPGGL